MRSVITALRGLRSGERCGHLVFLAMVMASLPAGLPAQDFPWRPNFFIRFWDLHVNPMEFRTPLTLAPFDLKFSLAPYGGPVMFQAFPLGFFGEDHSVVLLDSTESELPTINSLFSRLTFVYDLDLVKINVLHRLLPFSLLDMLVGVGIRTNQIPLARDLPKHWPPLSQVYKFAPVFQQALVNLTVGYQRSERWYAYLQMAKGLARGSVYRAGVADRYLRGTGASSDLAMGIKLFRRAVGGARYNVGLELRYHRLNVPRLEDPKGISPIEGLQMRYLGLFFTFGTAIGGKPTTADRAKRELYSGDYISAESNLRTFLDRSAGHAKERRARKMLALVERLVPYQQLALAQAAQREGRLKDALTWLDRAETRADTTIMGRVMQGRAEIGYIYLQHADSVLRTGDLSATDDILRTAEVLLPLSEDLVDRYDSEVLIRQGHALRAQGGFTAALRKYDLAAEADFSRAVEIDGYKVRVAEDLLKDAEAAAAGGALALALESLRLSRTLDPGRKAELDEMISKIEGHLAKIAQGEIRQSIEASMREARELHDRLPPTKPRIGLLVSQIEDILGAPDHVSQDTDRLGIDHQMWEYQGGDYPGLYYFEEYVLKRVQPGHKATENGGPR